MKCVCDSVTSKVEWILCYFYLDLFSSRIKFPLQMHNIFMNKSFWPNDDVLFTYHFGFSYYKSCACQLNRQRNRFFMGESRKTDETKYLVQWVGFRTHRTQRRILRMGNGNMRPTSNARSNEDAQYTLLHYDSSDLTLNPHVRNSSNVWTLHWWIDNDKR